MEKSWVKPVSLFIIYRHTGSVQCQLCDPEVVGLISGRVISKNLKNDTGCYFAWCSALRKWSWDWSSWCQYNVTGWNNMSCVLPVISQ